MGFSLSELNPLKPIVDEVGKIIDKVVPDRAAADAAKAALATQESLQKFQLLYAQIQANIEEAKSTNWFIAGWRPAAGWIATASLGMVYIPKALFITAIWVMQAYIAVKAGQTLPAFPDLGVSDIIGLLGSLLGIGTLRTAEKITNTEGNR